MSDIVSKIDTLSAGVVAGQLQSQRAASSAPVRAVKDSKNEIDAKPNQLIYEKPTSYLNRDENGDLEIENDYGENLLVKAAEILESYIPETDSNTKLKINKDEGSGRFVYQGIDKDSGEVVRQFPEDEILKFLARVREVEGLVVDGKV